MVKDNEGQEGQENRDARRGGNDRGATFRSLMTRLRARESLNAEEIQATADAFSKLWRERDMLYNNRISRARKMLDSMRIDEVISTGDITTPVSQKLKKGKKERSPHAPLKEESQESSSPRARTCARERFVKPTVDEVAAYVRKMGYTFDPEAFWFFYDSKGWMVGRNKMKSWTSACVTWQKKENAFSAGTGARAERKSAAPKASNWVGSTAEQRKEFCDGLEG